MIVRFELTRDEAVLLHRELLSRLEELDKELVRTDKRELQHELAVDEEKLKAIALRLQNTIERAR